MRGRFESHWEVGKRRRAEASGRTAEEAVAIDRQRLGFEILARRVRTGAGEIDLVVADRDTLIFIEVKARKSLEEAAYAVLPRQQLRLLEAASLALAKHEEWQRPEIRFDVALVAGSRITHIQDAIRYG